ncbi:hypothetical protein DSECCO2_448310 [anaerobic digester metagenome]
MHDIDLCTLLLRTLKDRLNELQGGAPPAPGASIDTDYLHNGNSGQRRPSTAPVIKLADGFLAGASLQVMEQNPPGARAFPGKEA